MRPSLHHLGHIQLCSGGRLLGPSGSDGLRVPSSLPLVDIPIGARHPMREPLLTQDSGTGQVLLSTCEAVYVDKWSPAHIQNVL